MDTSPPPGALARKRFWKRHSVQAAACYLAIWAGCVGYLAFRGGNFLFPVSSLVLFGFILTGAAIFLTRKTQAPSVPVARPRIESLVILGYLAFYSFVLFGPLSGLVKQAFAPGPVQEFAVLAYKLIVHLAIPALLIRAVHGHLKGIFDAGLRRRGVLLTLCVFSGLMIVLVSLLNSLFEQLRAKGISTSATAAWILAAWIWMALETGLTEEFLFRGLLQTRLKAWLGSAPMAIALTAIVFALVHVPSFYLRGGAAVAKQASDLPQIIALSIGGLGPIAIMLGTLWERTRSFLLVVLVHGAIDAMPYVKEMIGIWS
jgi:membrane protease YdiL (CAAX protease family)